MFLVRKLRSTDRYGCCLRTCLGLFETTVCNSFATMSGHVFSDIFTLNAVSVIKEHFSYSIDKSDSLFSL